MKIQTILFALASVASALGGLIEDRPFDPTQPLKVKVHPAVTTTLVFPYPVEVALGAGFLDEASYFKLVDSKGGDSWSIDYVFFHQSDSVLTLHPLKAEIGYRNLNVICDGQIVVIEPELTANVTGAHTKLTTVKVDQSALEVKKSQSGNTATALAKQKARSGSRAASANAGMSNVGERSDEMDIPIPEVPEERGAEIVRSIDPLAVEESARASVAQLMGMLKLTQLASVMNDGELESFKAESGYLEYSRKKPLKVSYDGYTITLHLVVRHNQIDALGFFGVIENTSTETLTLDSETWFARSGSLLLRRMVSEEMPPIPPSGSEPFWFVSYRTDSDQRNNTSESSEFIVGVSRKGA